MGPSLSPILSNIFIEYYESELLPQLGNIQWLRYVDDIFLTWPEREDFDQFFNSLNAIHPCIKFKVEWENEGNLPFLDILIHRSDNNRLSFSVFRKPTNSLSYIHYFSAHHDSVKKSTISSQFLRAYRICDPSFIDQEIDFIFSVFDNLGYPYKFISGCHVHARKCYYGERNKSVFNPDNNKVLTIPFSNSSSKLKRQFKNSGYEMVYSYPSTTSRMLFSNKPRNNLEDSPGTYYINCNNCTSRYFGETGRNLKTRVKEHQRCFRNADESNALFLHSRDTGHSINWNSSKVIFNSDNYVKRRIVESALIKEHNNMNTNPGSFSFRKVFNDIILKNVKM